MATKTTKTTKISKPNAAAPKAGSLAQLKSKMLEIRLAIKAHQEKNTNAHKSLRKQIAQLLTKESSSRTRGSI